MNFAKDQLFCLLGPNGAGKTTAINCLTGITPVTGGDGNMLISFTNQITSYNVEKSLIILCLFVLAILNFLEIALIYGYSIRSSIGMAKIRKLIGVCPQVTFSLSLSLFSVLCMLWT